MLLTYLRYAIDEQRDVDYDVRTANTVKLGIEVDAVFGEGREVLGILHDGEIDNWIIVSRKIRIRK